MTLRIGVDLGGTKTEAVVVRVSGDEPEVLAKKRVATEREKGYEHIVEKVRALVVAVAKDAAVSPTIPIGIGMPGAVSRRTGDELVKNSNTTCLNGRPFRTDLAKALGAEVAFANDANCFALAEARWGAARGARVTFGVIMGTGVGGGVVFGDRAWEGAQGIAGEWGHMPIEPVNGPPCYCGKRGCVETFLSGPAIERAFLARSGEALALPAIVARADAGPFLAECMDVFGRALAMVIDVLDPDVVVLGGGVSNVAALYDDGVAAVARWVFNDTLETRIVKNALGDSAGVLGAALLPRG